MRKIIFTLIAVLLLCVFPLTTYASTVTIPENMLTAEQKAQLALDETKNKVEQYGSWVGLGKEIGTAVDSSLGSLTNRADEFSKTNVGMFTMFLVAYKVCGTDLIQLMFGLLFCISSMTICFISFWRNAMRRKVVLEKKGFFLWGERKYTTVNSDSDQMWGHVIVAFAIIIVSCVIIFV